MVKKTIMVVDDEPMIVKVVHDIFKEEGYKVITALSGQECLEKLKKKKCRSNFARYNDARFGWLGYVL